jgi:hypothetical protein
MAVGCRHVTRDKYWTVPVQQTAIWCAKKLSFSDANRRFVTVLTKPPTYSVMKRIIPIYLTSLFIQDQILLSNSSNLWLIRSDYSNKNLFVEFTEQLVSSQQQERLYSTKYQNANALRTILSFYYVFKIVSVPRPKAIQIYWTTYIIQCKNIVKIVAKFCYSLFNMAMTFTSHHLPRTHFPQGKWGCAIGSLNIQWTVKYTTWKRKPSKEICLALQLSLASFSHFIFSFHRTQFITLVPWDTVSSFLWPDLYYCGDRAGQPPYGRVYFCTTLRRYLLPCNENDWWKSARERGGDKEGVSARITSITWSQNLPSKPLCSKQ